MSFTCWLRNVCSVPTPAPMASKHRRRALRTATHRPRLECLEDRHVPSTVVFEDHMDNGRNGWTSTGIWAQEARDWNSPETNWVYGPDGYYTGYWQDVWDPDSGEWTPVWVDTANSGTLTSPAISLAGTTEATLAFYERSDLEPWNEFRSGVDRTQVQVSANGGATWSTIFESHETDALWHQRIVDLSAYAGGTINLRFYFDTVDELINVYGGWKVDDVTVYTGSSAPLFSVSDASALEGDSGTTDAVFTVTLSAPASETAILHYATADATSVYWTARGYPGLATAGQDYLAVSGTLIFAPGETSKAITVPVLGDTVFERREPFFLKLSSPTNVITYGPGTSGIATIVDDEAVISLNTWSPVGEGDEGTTSMEFTVTLDQGSTRVVTVNYATGDGWPNESAATAGIDYAPVSGTLTFLPGETTKTITVLVYGDTIYEGYEYLHMVLGGASGALIIQGEGAGQIYDDDPGLWISDVTVTEGNVGTTTATFTVTRLGGYTKTVSVAYATADGTATAGSDYQAASGTLTFGLTEHTQTISVVVNGDRLVESPENFFINLSSPIYATIVDGQSQGTIMDDEPRVSINDVTRIEGNSGLTAFAFTVSLSVAYDVPVTVGYATADGTTTAGSDYQAATGTLTIPAGQTRGTITVPVNADRVGELNETFLVNLSNLNYGVIADGQGVGTIVDDEPRVSISDVTKKEGNGKKLALFVFTVSLSAAYDQPLTMSYRTVDGTATTSDSDYVAQTGTLTFAPGETAKTITIEVKCDNKREADEWFYLDLFGNSSNSLFTKNRGVGTILNDD